MTQILEKYFCSQNLRSNAWKIEGDKWQLVFTQRFSKCPVQTIKIERHKNVHVIFFNKIRE